MADGIHWVQHVKECECQINEWPSLNRSERPLKKAKHKLEKQQQKNKVFYEVTKAT